jgi:hypothetical protein
MFWWDNGYGSCAVISRPAEKEDGEYGKVIPAWSLHRLLELQLNSTDTRFEIRFNQLDLKDAYDFSVGHIEHLIKEGYFNKEYLDVD